MAYKTVRRDVLKRKVASGNYEARCAYNTTDDHAAVDSTRALGWLPARFTDDPWDRPRGVHSFSEDDFREGVRAYTSDDDEPGEIRLSIHRNLLYVFREIVPGRIPDAPSGTYVPEGAVIH